MTQVIVQKSSIGQQGVFTGEGIAEGDVVREFVLQREVSENSPLREDERPEYCTIIDGHVYLVGEPDRFFNHSCDPNVFQRFVGDLIQVVARRDIEAGSELCVDYLINNSGGHSWSCHCGAARCRGKTGFSFFMLPIEFQREYLPLLAPWFRKRHALEVEELEASR